MTDTGTQEELRQARKKAMRLLERMDRTEKGLKDRLVQAGFSESASEDAVAFVKGYGYINDSRYAENYIFSRVHEKSRQRILQELYQKGVARGTALEAWDRVCELEQPDERRLLRNAVEKKCSPGMELDAREMRRLYGYLARRGFRAGDISSVLEEMDIRAVL
ncbi:MAG TPA: recombination regulator RecX [Candidatus Blautia faecipullorum]|nr:recombination regulator RecX [Candidatus Blautia faecipullorum]